MHKAYNLKILKGYRMHEAYNLKIFKGYGAYIIKSLKDMECMKHTI